MKMLLKASLILMLLPLLGCSKSNIEMYGTHYQTHKDLVSLENVLNLIDSEADTVFIQQILGKPIDFGFDYRYLIDSTGPNGCTVGAVFHINALGKIDDKWIGEICE
ncbi:MAG: hypothetical protein AAGI07_08060 [Bacteroidota bacterium]